MPAIEGTAASEKKLRGRGKVRNKIGAEQRTEGEVCNRRKEADVTSRAEGLGL